jgi:hypothetical protein
VRHRTNRNCVTVTATDPMTRHSYCFSQHMSHNCRIPAVTLAAQPATLRFIERGGAGVPGGAQSPPSPCPPVTRCCGGTICRSATAVQRLRASADGRRAHDHGYFPVVRRHNQRLVRQPAAGVLVVWPGRSDGPTPPERTEVIGQLADLSGITACVSKGSLSRRLRSRPTLPSIAAARRLRPHRARLADVDWAPQLAFW